MQSKHHKEQVLGTAVGRTINTAIQAVVHSSNYKLIKGSMGPFFMTKLFTPLFNWLNISMASFLNGFLDNVVSGH